MEIPDGERQFWRCAGIGKEVNHKPLCRQDGGCELGKLQRPMAGIPCNDGSKRFCALILQSLRLSNLLSIDRQAVGGFRNGPGINGRGTKFAHGAPSATRTKRNPLPEETIQLIKCRLFDQFQ